MSQGRVLVVGCGFVGEAAADLMHAQGWEVSAWTASAESAARLQAEKPYAVIAHDITRGPVALAGAPDAVVHCVSSKGGGAPAYRQVYLEGARMLLAAWPTARFLFTSSTSVYAQTDGSWVDEQTVAEPTRETGQILRETEEMLLARGAVVLRLAGLYGPGRSTMLSRARAGALPIEGDGGRWMNFCHRDDAASAIALSLKESVGGLFNVADDCPIQQGDCACALAELFNQPAPPTAPPDLERKRGWTSKRVRAARLRGAGWRPANPSFLAWARSAGAAER